MGFGLSRPTTDGSLEQPGNAASLAGSVVTTDAFTHFQSHLMYEPDMSNCRWSIGVARISISAPLTLALPAFCGNAQGPGPPNCGQDNKVSCASLNSL